MDTVRVLTDRAGGADAPEPQSVSALSGAHPSRWSRQCPFHAARECIPARKYGKRYCARIEAGSCRLPSVQSHTPSPRTSSE